MNEEEKQLKIGKAGNEHLGGGKRISNSDQFFQARLLSNVEEYLKKKNGIGVHSVLLWCRMLLSLSLPKPKGNDGSEGFPFLLAE